MSVDILKSENSRPSTARLIGFMAVSFFTLTACSQTVVPQGRLENYKLIRKGSYMRCSLDNNGGRIVERCVKITDAEGINSKLPIGVFNTWTGKFCSTDGCKQYGINRAAQPQTSTFSDSDDAVASAFVNGLAGALIHQSPGVAPQRRYSQPPPARNKSGSGGEVCRSGRFYNAYWKSWTCADAVQ